MSEALELSNRAVLIYEREDSLHLVEALVNRGQVYVHQGRLQAGIADFGRVLESSNPRSNYRVYQSALHNLSYALTQAGTLHAGHAFAYIRRARHGIRGHERSISRAKLRWIEGLAYRALHMNARAEPLLEGAYKALVRLEAPYDAALVGLDLVEIFLLEGRSVRAGTLLEEAIGRLPERSGEKVGALRRVIEACRHERASRDLLLFRREIEERVFRVRRAQSARF